MSMPIPGITLNGISMKCTHLTFDHVALTRALQTKLMDPSKCLRKLEGNREALLNASDLLSRMPSFE